MSIFARPLVALSLTDPDAGLLRYARKALGENCESMRFVHVAADESLRESEAETLGLRMQSEVETHFGPLGAAARLELARGSRLDQLLTLAARHQHDVVLLGHRRGRSGRRSLARRLAMVAPCSVWLAPEGAEDRMTRILVPVDFSRHSADALSLATKLAAARGLAECLALHVFFDPSTLRYPEHVDEVYGQERSAMEKLLAEADCHGVSVKPLFEESAHPSQAILHTAKEHGADLIVMNTRGRTRAAAVLLGSVTSQTMTAATVPVLAVKHFGARETLLEVLMNSRFWRDAAPKTN
jgi:nucleotide-binding universal stress UspA family protein